MNMRNHFRIQNTLLALKINYVERINLTIRTSLARSIRKGMNFSKTMRMHKKALDLFQAWYNFIKPPRGMATIHSFFWPQEF